MNGQQGLKGVEVNQVLTGTVTRVDEKQALVDVGYKYDGILPISEVSSLHIEKVADVLSEGQEIQVKVIRIDQGKDEMIVSKRAVDAEKAWGELQKKFESGEVFGVVIADVVKGGLVVDLGVRGFIPASHVERHFVEDFSDYKGKTLSVKVIELDKEKNKVILSHRAVLEEEANKQKQKVLESLEPGSVIEGTVQRLTDFGAFVDVGGVDGLVHISEIAWHHVEKPADVLKEGQKVKVKVLKVDKENERISLSIKATLPGPWEQAADKFKAGDVVKGTVKRLISFGAFIEVAPGVEGLVHISQIANRHIGTPDEVLKEGEEVNVKILDFNPSEERMSLSIREALDEKQKQEVKKEVAAYQVEENAPGSMSVTIADRMGNMSDLLKKFKS
ncbi:30S ribosomal protein S1 [Aneurinibacillus thermoaerophilus]|nr:MULTISPECIES: 30S ribosomal protein S1 [Aneurinibacillus]MED0674987.1 30S ribosomal protein S1 [Aneurinibacillus thermoaerophilus]MED0679612.1 30S ribosomal protein S1 [Aneurinibacillus thermoaerophilus]MED0737390.1 30S ribosomal protein S1 [Aneurinibacillus thermoaerophilus]MED0756239.1 30S ribosomal protein S1 [Aneurinibacillus thermoaerophilus]MED0760326.1 30S ribosomal protein S1 [Aneurinibacillus thermoaerophilus]